MAKHLIAQRAFEAPCLFKLWYFLESFRFKLAYDISRVALGFGCLAVAGRQ